MGKGTVTTIALLLLLGLPGAAHADIDATSIGELMAPLFSSDSTPRDRAAFARGYHYAMYHPSRLSLTNADSAEIAGARVGDQLRRTPELKAQLDSVARGWINGAEGALASNASALGSSTSQPALGVPGRDRPQPQPSSGDESEDGTPDESNEEGAGEGSRTPPNPSDPGRLPRDSKPDAKTQTPDGTPSSGNPSGGGAPGGGAPGGGAPGGGAPGGGAPGGGAPGGGDPGGGAGGG